MSVSKEVGKPRWLYTAEKLNTLRPEKMGGWRPPHQVIWLNTNVNLGRPQAADVTEHHFDAMVQFRVDTLDAIKFGGISAGELVLPLSRSDPTKTNLLQAARQKTHTDQPDDGLSLGRVVNVDAIYHDSWVAIPHLWPCHREEVFGDSAWKQLLEQITLDEIIKGTSKLTVVTNVTSTRIAQYATAHHCMWRVGEVNFHVPMPKRVMSERLDMSRLPEGWTEAITKYQHPQIAGVQIDPDRRPAGVSLRKRVPETTEAVRRELVARGIQDL